MLSKKLESVFVLILGMSFLVGSLAADLIGIGNTPGFGRQQIIGALGGIVITAYGFHFLRRYRKTHHKTFRRGDNVRS
jgi:cytochrome c biogenesis protein CcdA